MKKYKLRVRLPWYSLNWSKTKRGVTIVWKGIISGFGFLSLTDKNWK